MDKYSRYKELRATRDASIAKESKYFITKDRPDYRYFEERLCPFCNSQNDANEYVMKNDAGNSFAKCKNCGMVYMNLVLREDIYLKYYTNSIETTAKEQIWNRSIENLKPIPKPLKKTRCDLLLKYTDGGKLLDFGCGFGKVAGTVKFYFDELEGIEIDSFCARFAREIFSLKVYNDFIEKLNLENRYDACIMYNSIEHLLHPRDTLKYIHRALKPGGKLFIECPNIEGMSMRLFKGKHHLVQSTEHVNLFSLKTLRKLVLSSSFSILEIRSRKIDITFNDLIVWIFKRDKFYHRCSDRFISRKYSKYYDIITSRADSLLIKFEPFILKLIPKSGSYCQVVAFKE